MSTAISNDEILALLIPEPSTTGGPTPMATALVRDEQFGLRLQSVVPSRQLVGRALVTARADTGIPILDPHTREIIGYEFSALAVVA
jgi:hypothetical protein